MSALSAERLACACGCGNLARHGRNYATGHRGEPTLRVRLLSHLIIDSSGCLLWDNSVDNGGYGRISVEGSPRQVHRVMWEMFEGAIPEGLQLDHVKDRGCANRNCASIAHLEPVTGRINVLRGASPAAVHAAQTRCDSGHEFTPDNTYVSKDGKRACRSCRCSAENRERNARNNRAYRARKKGVAA